MRIGIDVGGTNTDAVLMGRRRRPRQGQDADHGRRDERDRRPRSRRSSEQTRVGPTAVTAVMIGTTHFTNAVVERRRLQPVAAVRLGLPATSLPAADGGLAGRPRRASSAATATSSTGATSSTAGS